LCTHGANINIKKQSAQRYIFTKTGSKPSIVLFIGQFYWAPGRAIRLYPPAAAGMLAKAQKELLLVAFLFLTD
jgi:hypothetical protein